MYRSTKPRSNSSNLNSIGLSRAKGRHKGTANYEMVIQSETFLIVKFKYKIIYRNCWLMYTQFLKKRTPDQVVSIIRDIV